MRALRTLPWAIWLDSGGGGSTSGRYDICMAAPVKTLLGDLQRAELRDAQGQLLQVTSKPMTLLRVEMQQRRSEASLLPFCGGAAGYFSYDFGLQLQGVPTAGMASLPALALGFYDWAFISDRQERRSWWVGRPAAEALLPELLERLRKPEPGGSFRVDQASVSALPEWPQYQADFERVAAHIQAGDCYQINLARRFQANYQGDPWSAYLRLRDISPAAFSAYLALPFASILSGSPERFLQLQDGWVEARPIKGTRPRRADPAEDAAEIESLRRSDKDRAENVMIVDLLRNDLGRVCQPGSVEAERLFEIESYATVHHMVSTVRGQLRAGLDAVDVLESCLPGGSITGAPKRRAMEIINALEPASRGVYCGVIGYLSDDGCLDTNIAIRTAVCQDGVMSYWAGGGLVADSEACSEFSETLHKAEPFLRLLQAAAADGIRD